MSLLALLNPSRAFLAMSTVLAGYCLIRFYAFTAGNLLVMPYLLVAGALLGMADFAWGVIFTAAAEQGDSSRELPSGTLSTTAAYLIASFTTLAGLMCAMTGGYNAFRAAGVLILLTLVRTALFRKVEVVSPILRGLGFGMLFVIGMAAHPSFIEMLFIGETRIPLLFFIFYMIVAAVLSQVRDSSKPRAVPSTEELTSETASRLLEMRDDAIDGLVAWFAGGAVVLLPLLLAWIMPWRWLSWTIMIFLSASTLFRLVPVLVYRTRRDLNRFVESVFRGGALLNAGAVASLGDYYRKIEIYREWQIPMPGRDELAAIIVIALLAAPAWLLRNTAPVDG